MSQWVRITGMLVLVAILPCALRFGRSHSAPRLKRESLNDTIHEVIRDPVTFSKNRFTGGIGIILIVDPATGLPAILEVMAGSPAKMAGLQAEDVIMKVNGVPTKGQTMPKIADSIRGFVVANVTLSVQRSGSTNLECVVHRTSWKSLGIRQ